MTNQPDMQAEQVASDFITAFASGDYDRMASLLSDDVESYVTNAEGGVNRLTGRDAYMKAITSVDYKTVKPSIAITQTLTVKPGQVMVMVEIKAERKGRTLHNFATFLFDISQGRIDAMRMVEALPAYSDAFWKD